MTKAKATNKNVGPTENMAEKVLLWSRVFDILEGNGWLVVVITGVFCELKIFLNF
jgi:hypothetical protein